MKKVILIILLISASCLYSQDKTLYIEISRDVPEFLPSLLVNISIVSPDSRKVFESGLFEQKDRNIISVKNWYKKPGIYRLNVSVKNNYSMRLINSQCLAFELNGNENRVSAGVSFSTDIGESANHLYDIRVNRYYTSSDSITIKENWVPKSNGHLEYKVQNNSERTIYGFYFFYNIIGELEIWESGKWKPLFRGSGMCGRYGLDVPLNPGDSVNSSEQGFVNERNILKIGKYKYTVEYTFDKVFDNKSVPDREGVSKNIYDYYRLEKEFEIKED